MKITKKNLPRLLPGILILGVVLAFSASSAFADQPESMESMTVSGANSITSEDVTIYLESVEVGDETIQLTLCADLPSLGDWFPFALLNSEKGTLEDISISLQNVKDPDTSSSLYRVMTTPLKIKMQFRPMMFLR